MRITIKTRLDEGIYESCGGGQVLTHYKWNIGPRNLIKAFKALREHSRLMTQSYGNIGHSGSWIEVNGTRVSGLDESEFQICDDGNCTYKPVTKTEWAKRYIQKVLDGTLKKEREDFARFQDKKESAEQIGFDDGVKGNPKKCPPELLDAEYYYSYAYNKGLAEENVISYGIHHISAYKEDITEEETA